MIPSAAFAVDPEVIEVGEQAGALIYDLYGAANNTSLAYDSIQPGPALTEIITLFQEAQATTGGEPISMTAIGTALLAAGAIGVVYDAGEAVYKLAVDLNYQNFGEFWYDFNHGWDYILSDVGGLIRDSVTDLFSWSDATDSIEIVAINPDNIYTVPYYTDTNVVNMYQNGNKFFANDFYKYAICTDYSDPLYFAVVYNGSTYQVICFRESTSLSPSNNKANIPIVKANVTSYASTYVLLNGAGNLSNGMRYYTTNITFTGGVSDSSQFTVPLYSTIADAISNVISYTNGLQRGSIDIKPSIYIGDPLQNPLEITIPDPSTPMTDPLRIGTNIEVDPQLLPDSVPADPVPGTYYPITDPAALNDIVPEAWEDVVSSGVEVDPETVPDDPGPGPDGSITEVFTPLLPTTLPSFDFNFSSIWHYVREWVSSLRSFFTVLFSVWAALPYAIVVPVYATAVIVIVLGVYKRFFG